MMTRFYVTYTVNEHRAGKYCDSKRDASNLARKMSKNGSVSQIYRCSGIMHDGTFYETESTYVAHYKDGKRQ